MFLHQLKSPVGSRKRKKIVGRGRGSGHGKNSGRGENGQKSRSGRATIHMLEGGQTPLIRRLPKVGFRSKCPTLYQVVNLDQLNCFANGAQVDVYVLKEKGLVKSFNAPFKILGTGELKKKQLKVAAHSFSRSAEEKIKQAGGSIEILTSKITKPDKAQG